MARARRIFEEAGEDTPEAGWVLIVDSFAEQDMQIRESMLREASAIGRRFGDPAVEFDALAYLGGVLMLTNRVEDGLVCLDEVLAAAIAGELTDISVVDSTFCAFFWACELVNDVPRADQWMRAAEDLMKRRNVVAAYCRAHYGGILTAAGRWSEAEVQFAEAARHFDRGVSARRDAVLIRLANLRLRQGRIEEGSSALGGTRAAPRCCRRTRRGPPGPRGETGLARDLLERRTADPARRRS